MDYKATQYFLKIPETTEGQHHLNNLLSGLEHYYQLTTENILLISTMSPTLDPIFSKLAFHVVRPKVALPPVPTEEPVQEADGRRSYSVPGCKEKMTKSEVMKMLEKGAIPEGVVVRSNRWSWTVKRIDGKFELTR